MKEVKRFETEKVAKDNFKYVLETINLLKSLGYECSLDSGTLLGYTREGKIITHDYDYDLVAFVKGESLKDFAREFKKLRRTISEIEGETRETRETSIHIQLERDFNIDIFVGFVYFDKVYIYPHIHGMNKEDYFPIQQGEMYGHKVPVPKNCELFCKEVYDDWKTPEKDWDWDWKLDKGPVLEDFKFIYRRLKI